MVIKYLFPKQQSELVGTATQSELPEPATQSELLGPARPTQCELPGPASAVWVSWASKSNTA